MMLSYQHFTKREHEIDEGALRGPLTVEGGVDRHKSKVPKTGRSCMRGTPMIARRDSKNVRQPPVRDAWTLRLFK